MAKKLRIMHGPSEVAGQNSYSVRGLKELGENAECVVYFPSVFGYPYDRNLNLDRKNKKMLPIYAMKMFFFFLSALGKYDCFHFHYGHTILDGPELALYHLFRKKIFFEFHGSELREPDSKLDKRNRRICRKADGIIVHDDELIPFLPKERAPVYVVPLRVDISQFTPVYPDAEASVIRIVHAPSVRAAKGTKYILEAFEKLKEKYNNLEFVLVEGKTQQEAFEIYKTADIIVDQVCIGTYGVFAIESMAMGKPVVVYINDEMKERLPEDLPVVSADKDSVESALEELINNGELRRKKGMEGRKYVENYHDYRYGAAVLRDVYYGKAEPIIGRDAFQRAKDIREKISGDMNDR